MVDIHCGCLSIICKDIIPLQSLWQTTSWQNIMYLTLGCCCWRLWMGIKTWITMKIWILLHGWVITFWISLVDQINVSCHPGTFHWVLLSTTFNMSWFMIYKFDAWLFWHLFNFSKATWFEMENICCLLFLV